MYWREKASKIIINDIIKNDIIIFDIVFDFRKSHTTGKYYIIIIYCIIIRILITYNNNIILALILLCLITCRNYYYYRYIRTKYEQLYNFHDVKENYDETTYNNYNVIGTLGIKHSLQGDFSHVYIFYTS